VCQNSVHSLWSLDAIVRRTNSRRECNLYQIHHGNLDSAKQYGTRLPCLRLRVFCGGRSIHNRVYIHSWFLYGKSTGLSQNCPNSLLKASGSKFSIWRDWPVFLRVPVLETFFHAILRFCMMIFFLTTIGNRTWTLWTAPHRWGNPFPLKAVCSCRGVRHCIRGILDEFAKSITLKAHCDLHTVLLDSAAGCLI